MKLTSLIALLGSLLEKCSSSVGSNQEKAELDSHGFLFCDWKESSLKFK